MSTTQRIGRLLEPALPEDRERRPIAGLENRYEITRTGHVWSVEDGCWLRNTTTWPFLKVPCANRTVDLVLPEAVAVSWLSAEDRSNLRAAFPGTPRYSSPWPVAVLEAEQALQVYAPALADVIRTTDDSELSHWHRTVTDVPVTAESARKVDDRVVQRYKVVLVDRKRYRTPHIALHCHYILVRRNWYSFLAMGTKPWAAPGDSVSFAYRVSKAGRNLFLDKTSLSVRDPSGKPVVRNNNLTKSSEKDSATPHGQAN
jgi:hypothetical protein